MNATRLCARSRTWTSVCARGRLCAAGQRPRGSASVCAHEPMAPTHPDVLGWAQEEGPPKLGPGPRLPPPSPLLSPGPTSTSPALQAPPPKADPRASAPTPSSPRVLPGHRGLTHFCASRERPGHTSPAGLGQLRRRKRRLGPQLFEQGPHGPHAPHTASAESKETDQGAAFPHAPGDNAGLKSFPCPPTPNMHPPADTPESSPAHRPHPGSPRRPP